MTSSLHAKLLTLQHVSFLRNLHLAKDSILRYWQMKIKILTWHAIQKHVCLVQWGYAVFWTHGSGSNIYFNSKPTWSQSSRICIDSTPTMLLESKWRLINSFSSTLQNAITLHRTCTNYYVNDLYQNRIMHKEW